MPFNSKSIEKLILKAGSQKKLARETGIGETTIYRWKMGTSEPNIKQLDQLYIAAKMYGGNIEFYTPPE